MQNFSYAFYAQDTADQLRLPLDVLLKLRRMHDPNLSFEEHNEIFPLDLGPIWELAAFSATKRIPKNTFDPIDNDLVASDWGSIHDQFSKIMSFGLMGKCEPPAFDGSKFLFNQSLIRPGSAILHTRVHADGQNEKACFKEAWAPPTQIHFIARDVPPTTVFIKGFDFIPWDLVDRQATEQDIGKLQTFMREAAEELGRSIDIPDFGNLLRFKDEAFIRHAEEASMLRTFEPGHVIGFTDRCLHAGRRTLTSGMQTWAHAEANIIR